MGRSTAAPNASRSRPTTSSRSIPRSRARWFQRAGRDHHHRDTALCSNAGDERLGPIATGHADHVGAPVDRIHREVEQVVAGLEYDGFDSTTAALVHEVEPLRLSAAGLEVHDEHAELHEPQAQACRRSRCS